jgi:hypothetical protein
MRVSPAAESKASVPPAQLCARIKSVLDSGAGAAIVFTLFVSPQERFYTGFSNVAAQQCEGHVLA